MLVVWKRAFAWWVPTIFAVWIMGAMIHDQFDPEFYATRLRNDGYGGGIPVSIRLSAGDNQIVPFEKSGYMLLRTSSTIVLFDEATNRIEEYSLSKIDRVSYTAGGLKTLKPKLPSASPSFSTARP